jgi:hypothetical protein
MCILFWHKIMELKVLETRASLIQEKNEYRLVNSRVHSIVLKCLEPWWNHELTEITSQSTIVYCFTSLCFNSQCRL